MTWFDATNYRVQLTQRELAAGRTRCPCSLERVAQIRPSSATCPTGLTIRDVLVIDAAQARVTIRMFNGNARPHDLLSENVSTIGDSVLRAGSDDRGGRGSTSSRCTWVILAIRSWNEGSLCSFRRLEADRV